MNNRKSDWVILTYLTLHFHRQTLTTGHEGLHMDAESWARCVPVQTGTPRRENILAVTEPRGDVEESLDRESK